jgi:hypothetical protein
LTDLKPSNVMLVPDQMVTGGERVKLLDFGIAKLSQSSSLEGDPQTRTGAFLGTPRYMSPEQCRGNREIDGKSDVYSLGVMLYEMLAGRMPFITKTDVALVAAHLIEEPTPLREVAPNVSIDTCRLIDSMLRKKKEERPSMVEIAKAIGEHTAHHVEEQATAIISSLPDKEVLRAMISGGAVPGVPKPPDSKPGVKKAPPPPPSNPGVGRSSASGLPPVPAADVSRSGADLVPPGDGSFGTTLRGSVGQRSVSGAPGRAQRIVGIGIGALVVSVLALLLVTRLTPSPPPAKVAAPAPAPVKPVRVHWSIVTDPPGADVIRDSDGNVLGTTPFSLHRDAASGSEVVRLHHDGYREATVILVRDHDVSIDKSLVALPPPAPPDVEKQPKSAPPSKPAKKPAKKPTKKQPEKPVTF